MHAAHFGFPNFKKDKDYPTGDSLCGMKSNSKQVITIDTGLDKSLGRTRVYMCVAINAVVRMESIVSRRIA